MGRTLLTNAYLVTMDPQRRVIPQGWIAFEDDRIEALGDMASQDRQEADETIDLHGMVALPGLINGHNHHWASLFKNTGEGLYLEEWIDRVTFPLGTQLTNEDHRVGAYLGAIEQIRTGTTCSLNHVNMINDADSMRAMIEPVIDVGVRQLVTKELRGTPQPPFNPDFPSPPHVRGLDEEVRLAADIVDEWQGAGGLIRMGLAIESGGMWMLHNATSDDVVRAGVALAREKGLKITNHCSAGTPWLSIKEFEEATGGGDVDYLVRLGVMVDNWVLAHSLWLKDREIDAVARSGASVVTNPVSNAYSCDGMAPLKRMMAAGINIGLGSDGAYVNGSVDMVEQMKFCVLMQNVLHLDPRFLSAERALEMATINGARALGMDDDIGSLEPGKKADVVVFDLSGAHVTVPNRPVAALVFSAHGTDAHTVFVNGEKKLSAGELVGFDDEAAVLEEARGRARSVIERAGLAERVFQHWRSSPEWGPTA